MVACLDYFVTELAKSVIGNDISCEAEHAVLG